MRMIGGGLAVLSGAGGWGLGVGQINGPSGFT